MSTAEKTAIDFYNTFHLAAMPSDVKRHLMILLLQSPSTKEYTSYMDTEDEKDSGILAEPEPFTMEDINKRLDMAEADMKAGRIMSCESVHECLEQKFPWLCE